MNSFFIGILALLLTVGCAASDTAMREEPPRFDDEVVDTFVAGETTRD